MFKKGQTWSFDLIIAVVLFVVIIGLFYSIMASEEKKDGDVILEESKKISERMDCDKDNSYKYCFVEKGVMDEEKFKELMEKNYELVKSDLGIVGDFCIYLKDLEGNLITIENLTGFGNEDFILTNSNFTCGQNLTGII